MSVEHSEEPVGLDRMFIAGIAQAVRRSDLQGLQVDALKPHQLRVLAEKCALDEKLLGLQTFIGGVAYRGLSQDEQVLLRLQCFVMSHYSDVLGERINAFKGAPT